MLLELLLFAVIGLAVGSFLTLVVERFDTAESVITGRSHCNHCKETLRWWELLPFLGYFIVKGQCPRCNKTIPKIYPLFEIVTAVVFVLMRFFTPEPVNYVLLILQLVLASVLLALLFYDALFMEFPTLLLAKAGVLALIIAGYNIWNTSSGVIDGRELVYGVLVGGGLLGLLAFPSRGTWMGYGDVVLGAILGIWLGYPLIIIALLTAFYVGAFVGIIQLVTKRVNRDHRIAFGPFLILGGFVAHFWGGALLMLLYRLWGIV